jgi:hypothetical protein
MRSNDALIWFERVHSRDPKVVSRVINLKTGESQFRGQSVTFREGVGNCIRWIRHNTETIHVPN